MDYPLQVQHAKATGQLTVTSPYDGSSIGSVPTINKEGVDQALKNAAALFADKSLWLPGEQRIQILRNMTVLMEQHYERLVDQAVAEGGKPLLDTRIEMDRAIDGI
ncbi:MAG: aldehyde dehydrogenase family protein, partial [Thiotrichaceae bacterium]